MEQSESGLAIIRSIAFDFRRAIDDDHFLNLGLFLLYL